MSTNPLNLTPEQAIAAVERPTYRCDCRPGVDNCSMCSDLHKLRADLQALYADHARLLRVENRLAMVVAAAQNYVDDGPGLKYEDGEDDVGTRTCCNTVSYNAHATDCPFVRLRDVLAAKETEA